MKKAAWIGIPFLALAVGAGAYMYAGNGSAACPVGSEVKMTSAEGSLKDRMGCCEADGETATTTLASAEKTDAAACPVTDSTATETKMVKMDAAHGDDCCAVEETEAKIADNTETESEDLLAQAD